MADKVFGIDKGIMRAFGLMVAIVGLLTTFFLSEYVSTVVLGSVFYPATNGTYYATTTVTGETFTPLNATYAVVQLANADVTSGTLAIYNTTSLAAIPLSNFSIDYTAGNVTVLNNAYHNQSLSANYSYATTTTTNLPISSDANTLVGSQEDDFVTTFGYVNTGAKFAGALITVVAVILVFVSFLPNKGKREKPMDY